MKNYIQKIISGGQTGADFAGLVSAKKLGYLTGGIAPKNYKTENGPNYDLISYGLEQCSLSDYDTRTRKNVEYSDMTLIFSTDTNSKGTLFTIKCCKNFGKQYLVINPNNNIPIAEVRNYIEEISEKLNKKLIINIAGNRESISPGIGLKTEELLNFILK